MAAVFSRWQVKKNENAGDADRTDMTSLKLFALVQVKMNNRKKMVPG